MLKDANMKVPKHRTIRLLILLGGCYSNMASGSVVINRADVRAGVSSNQDSDTYSTVNLYHSLHVYQPIDYLSQFSLNMELYRDAWLNSDGESDQAFNLSEFFVETEKIYQKKLRLKLGRQSLTEGFSFLVFDGLKATYDLSNTWSLTAYSGVNRYDESSTKLKTEYVPANGLKLNYMNRENTVTSYVATQNRVFRSNTDTDEDGGGDKNSALLVSHSSAFGAWDSLRIYYRVEGETERQELLNGTVGMSNFIAKNFSVDLSLTEYRDTYHYADVRQSVYKNFFTGKIRGGNLGLVYLTESLGKWSSRIATYDTPILGQYHQVELGYDKKMQGFITDVYFDVGEIRSDREYARSGTVGLVMKRNSYSVDCQLSTERYKKLNNIEGQYMALETGLSFDWQNTITNKAAVIFEKLDPKEEVKTSFLWFFSYWGISR